MFFNATKNNPSPINIINVRREIWNKTTQGIVERCVNDFIKLYPTCGYEASNNTPTGEGTHIENFIYYKITHNFVLTNDIFLKVPSGKQARGLNSHSGTITIGQTALGMVAVHFELPYEAVPEKEKKEKNYLLGLYEPSKVTEKIIKSKLATWKNMMDSFFLRGKPSGLNRWFFIYNEPLYKGFIWGIMGSFVASGLFELIKYLCAFFCTTIPKEIIILYEVISL